MQPRLLETTILISKAFTVEATCDNNLDVLRIDTGVLRTKYANGDFDSCALSMRRLVDCEMKAVGTCSC